MTPDSISDYILRSFEHVAVASAYGDVFFFYNPSEGGANEIYFATIKVSDNDLDRASGLDRMGAFRLNMGVDHSTFLALFGAHRKAEADAYDYSEVNKLLPHPVYGGANWVCVLNPTAATFEEKIAPLIKEAFISAEDKNFYTHGGYDARSIAAAVIEAVQTRGGRVRGASTITQQVMKNFLLSGDRRLERKIKEIILAARLEETLDKEQILELYLNEIYLGQNSYGVTAAAQTYFNKTLGELRPAEAATLAAMPQAPSRSMVRDRDTIIARREYVLRQMLEEGYIDAATFDAENATPLRTVQGGDYAPFRDSLPSRDYFTDEIRRQLSREFGEDEFFGGGLAIRATLVPDLQQIAAGALREALDQLDAVIALIRASRTVEVEQFCS